MGPFRITFCTSHMLGNNGKENGNYYSILGFILGIMEKKMETTIIGDIINVRSGEVG